jgi:histidine triad (HIT) family protein
VEEKILESCIFCKIINKQIPAEIVYEDDRVMAFKDIQPVAPVHVLIIPKKHISSIKEVNAEDAEYITAVHVAAAKIAEKMGVSDSGFRVITNCGADAGQTVFHLHYHLMGGRNLGPMLI